MSMSVRETTLTQDISAYLRHQLRGWRAVVAAGVVLSVPALWFGWPWLVAAGLAPLILTMAPCAVMCAAGLCMHRAGKTSVSSNGSQAAADSIMPRISAGAEPEQSPSLGACCGDRESSTENNAPHSPAQSIQTKQKEMIQ